MKIYQIFCLMFALSGGLTACGQDEVEGIETPVASTVSIDFGFSVSEQIERRSTVSDEIAQEEGNVNSLLYGIFKDGILQDSKKIEGLDKHTGDVYRITGLAPEWFTGGKTEIFVVANPTDAILTYLASRTNRSEWENCVFWENMNKTVESTPERRVLSPLMAGYLSLEGNFESVISVPVEHIYSRIWYTFGWRGNQEADQIVIDEVKISNLMYRTKLFNASNQVGGYDPGDSPDKWGITTIKQQIDHNLFPFMGDLSASDGQYFADKTQMLLTADTREQFNVLCHFPYDGPGQTVNMAKPIRYYTYCFQWDGTSLEDDPLIEISYHFTLRGTDKVVRKKASARLYDDNYFPGKRHHGMMRNYTYHTICLVNTTTNQLDLQVTAHPWMELRIDDIPPFE